MSASGPATAATANGRRGRDLSSKAFESGSCRQVAPFNALHAASESM
jgi:hypothetical protein